MMGERAGLLRKERGMLPDKVRSAIKKQRLLSKGDKVVVGVSGGPDSVALLYILKSLSKELRLNLHVAHLDHMLRKDSAGDRRFVENLAHRLKVPFTCGRINIKELAGRGSLEEIARNARLAFLFRVARKIKAKKIALGHNLDDQAETVLMRIIRGTGLYGLSGILPERRMGKFKIIRPLLEVRRREIEKYLRNKKIKARTDLSNLEDIYLRNKIRNRLLPLLEKKYNRNIKEVLANLALSAGCDYDYLISQAKRKMRKGAASITLKKFLKLPLSLKRLLLRLHIQRLSGDTRRLTFRHMREIEDLIYNRPPGSVVDLPRGLSLLKRQSCLVFRKS